ncbi:MAG: DUF5807 family protein [Halanaeroarchaeum sp.]
MTADRVEAFRRGDRPDDVALYLAGETVSDLEELLAQPYAQKAGDGVIIVTEGDRGRAVFEQFTGEEAMTFTGAAMQRDGTIAPSLAGGRCPDDEGGTDHDPVFVFSFVEEQNEDVGGLYADGDVVHAYAQCSCGTAYADKWIADER